MEPSDSTVITPSALRTSTCMGLWNPVILISDSLVGGLLPSSHSPVLRWIRNPLSLGRGGSNPSLGALKSHVERIVGCGHFLDKVALHGRRSRLKTFAKPFTAVGGHGQSEPKPSFKVFNQSLRPQNVPAAADRGADDAR